MLIGVRCFLVIMLIMAMCFLIIIGSLSHGKFCVT
jgi:hypothetical protein